MLQAIAFNIALSLIVSAVVCSLWMHWFTKNFNIWLENFFEEELEEKKKFMKEFIKDVKRL